MSTFYAILRKAFIVAAVTCTVCACSKDEEPAGPSNEDILTKKIEDIIPTEYLDTLRQMGLTVNSGTEPPFLEGSYNLRPVILDTSNIATDSRGHRFVDAIFHLSEQSDTDYSINLIGENFLSVVDTSIATAISGSGNNFTIYGKVKSVMGSYYAIFAILLSGTQEGEDLKNVELALMNIDNSKGGSGIFIEEGQARIAFDSDFITERRSSVEAAVLKNALKAHSPAALGQAILDD